MEVIFDWTILLHELKELMVLVYISLWFYLTLTYNQKIICILDDRITSRQC